MNDSKENFCKLFDIQKWIPEFSIDHEKRNALCFRETLIICSKNESMKDTKPIGGYCILVESVGPQAHEFLVHVQSSMSVDGHFGGSKVISSATSKFHCLEEKRTEFVYEDDGLHEKTIFVGMEDNFYYVKLTRTRPCDKSTEIKDLSFRCSDQLISEGVNVLLMRYLALINYDGTLSFESINMNGDLTTSNYTCTPAERMEIDDHFLNVYTIERKIHKKDKTVHTIKTYLTTQGKILRHNWLDVPYILKINPLVNPNVTSKTIRVETPLKDRWSEDIEMVSKYLDMKFSKMAEQTEYLADHPEVKQLIADYTQTLLVVKPENVIDFTIQHFKTFAKNPITWETSTLKENYDVDIKSQLTKEKSEVVCSICGFCIDNNMLNKISSRFSVGECSKIMSPHDSTESAHSKNYNDITVEKQEKNNASTSKMFTSDIDMEKEYSIPGNFSQLKETCNQCHALVRACNKHQSLAKCPGCLKVFSTCTKCSTTDQILQNLKK